MLSPDGKWFWDGTQWQLIATQADAGHIGVFPSWNTIHVDAATTASQVAQPVQVATPAPGIQYAPVVSSPLDYSAGGAAPLWRRERASKISFPIYIAGAVIAVVVLVALAGSMARFISWPWSSQGDSGPSTSTSALPPLASRSDFARADQFDTGALSPAMGNLGQTLILLNVSCNGTLTQTCQNAIEAADGQVKKVLAAIDRGPIAGCIAGYLAKMKVDLTGIGSALNVARKGFADNSRTELGQGLRGYATNSRALQTDYAGVETVRKSQCDTRMVGP